MRVPVGADDVGNDTERTASVTRALTRVHEHGGERAGRIGMSAVAEDDVEHDHRRAAVTGRVDDRGVSKARVDDRVRSPARVLLSAEVDEPVDTATNQATRFFAQGASGIEADDAAARGGRGDDRAVQAARGGTGESNSRDGRLLQRRHDLEARWDLSVVAEEAGDGGFPYSGRGGEHAVGDVARRRLRHDHDHAGPIVFRQPAESLERGHAADRGVEISSAGADRVGDSAAEAVDERRDLLDAGARGADHTDRAAADTVREPEPDAVDDRGPAFGPHDDEAELAPAELERHLVGERNAVAEEEDVEARRQRLVSVDGRVGTGDGDQREIRNTRATSGTHDRAWRHVVTSGRT